MTNRIIEQMYEKGTEPYRFGLGSLKGKVLNLRNISIEYLDLDTCILIKKKFPNLEQLILNRTNLIGFPIDGVRILSQLNKLKFLHLKNNEITAIPEDFFNISQLTHLYLNDNKLTALPQAISRLNNLIHLNLRSNPINELPKNIYNIGSLNFLGIRRTNIQYVDKNNFMHKNIIILQNSADNGYWEVNYSDEIDTKVKQAIAKYRELMGKTITYEIVGNEKIKFLNNDEWENFFTDFIETEDNDVFVANKLITIIENLNIQTKVEEKHIESVLKLIKVKNEDLHKSLYKQYVFLQLSEQSYRKEDTTDLKKKKFEDWYKKNKLFKITILQYLKQLYVRNFFDDENECNLFANPENNSENAESNSKQTTIMASELTGYLKALNLYVEQKNGLEAQMPLMIGLPAIQLKQQIDKLDETITDYRLKVKSCVTESKTTEIVEAAKEFSKLPEKATEAEKQSLLSKIGTNIKTYGLPIASGLQLTKVLLEMAGVDTSVISKVLEPLEKILE